jgi:hypothetical protein
VTLRGAFRLGAILLSLAAAATVVGPGRLRAAAAVPTPEQFIGFKVGADNKLARWDRILDYMKAVAAASDRVRVQELGKTAGNNPFALVEISSPDTLKNIDRYKQLERQLYFQDGVPAARDRDELFRRGKIVIAVTCGVHANEVGATQMSMALVHQLATDDSPAVRKILDNVIFLLVPSANPDGEIAIADWFTHNAGTPYATSPLPYLYHRYAGHDLNRDMYMLTQKESQYMAQVMWHDWLPMIWLDEHQMDMNGPRIFVMPAGDPINLNVHPLIYRWNGILGQSQAAALEAAGKDGIIYSSTYTNFWEGAMAWSSWWHNQIGLLTEVASVRLAAPIDQMRASIGRGGIGDSSRVGPNAQFEPGMLPAPLDITPRTEYPRPWLGGHWSLSDIVDYELISTMSLLETAADRRETMLRQIYEINRQTVEAGRIADVTSVVIPVERQHDAREVAHLVERLQMGGIEVSRAEAPFELDGHRYPAGTFVIPLTQPFARYAKDLLEAQAYPEVKSPLDPLDDVESPYDVTAWSLGMLLGVDVDFGHTPVPADARLTKLKAAPAVAGQVAGDGPRYTFDYGGGDSAIAINRLLAAGAQVSFDGPSHVAVTAVARDTIDAIARDLGVAVTTPSAADAPAGRAIGLHAPRVALYAPWTGGNIDEGWTRWVLEQYEFNVTEIHNADVRDRGLRERFDVVILADQSPRDIIDGFNATTIRPEYRGGIGPAGVSSLQKFVSDGGTLVALGAAADLAIDRFPIGVRDVKRGLRREQNYGPGTILKLQVDTSQPLGYGMAQDTYGFYNNGPFFVPLEGPGPQKTTVVARFPIHDVIASGWLKGEEFMAGRAAVVSVDMNPGRIVLFGIRPQHRAQTHATFPLLFNALYMAAADTGTARRTQ